ncbi:MAG: hypothetical protein ASARMPRED_001681 [Alectoria sarmentosa]|nr:MAG: hypothetical protein ASARMPRED_001681 [Alectoria sarmentosa]
MGFRRSFPTKHSHDGINTLLRKQRIASHSSRILRTLSRFRSFVTSTFIKVTGTSSRDEDGIDWGDVGSGKSEELAEEVCGDFGGVLKEDEEMRFKLKRLDRTLQKTNRTDTYR